METEKKFEIEYFIKQNDINKNSDLNLNDLNFEEAAYMIRALFLPMNEFVEALVKYDQSSFLLKDETSLVSGLGRKYETDRKTIIDRIREIRKIIKCTPKDRMQEYLNLSSNLEKTKKKMK